jgi:uncharacterized protein YicC (UPF0701 family)
MTQKALRALREAVAEVVAQHQREGRPLAVWQNGRAVLVPSDVKSLVIREMPAVYKARRRSRS